MSHSDLTILVILAIPVGLAIGIAIGTIYDRCHGR